MIREMIFSLPCQLFSNEVAFLLSLAQSTLLTEFSIRRTSTVGPFLSLIPLFDCLKDGHQSVDKHSLHASKVFLLEKLTGV